jgi:predicted nuclease with TOPRIM domain
MSDLGKQLADIKQKLRRFILLFNQIKAERNSLLEENLNLRNALDDEKKKVAELENKNINLQLSGKFAGSAGDNAALKQKLDEFIKEIDTCIAQWKG